LRQMSGRNLRTEMKRARLATWYGRARARVRARGRGRGRGRFEATCLGLG